MRLFAQKKSKAKVKKAVQADPGAKGGKGKGKADSGKPLPSILSFKRNQNTGILLAKLKMKPKTAVEAALQVDEDLLDEDMCKALSIMLPQADEEEMPKLQNNVTSVEKGGGDPAKRLPPADWFIYCLGCFPRLGERLQCVRIMDRLEQDVDTVGESIASIRKAVRDMKESLPVKVLLRTALGIGNFMNGGSSKGGAWGFKYSSLAKMYGTKATTGSQTLLQVVIGEAAVEYARTAPDVEERSPKRMLERLQDVMEGFTEQPVALPQLREMVQGLDKARGFLDTELDAAREQPVQHFLTDAKDELADVLGEVVEDAQDTLDAI